MKKVITTTLLAISVSLCGCKELPSSLETNASTDISTNSLQRDSVDTPQNITTIESKSDLGKALFNDTRFSLTRNMSCATCHNPEHAFVDTRENIFNSAVSLGDDGISFGDRNAPMVTYAAFIPRFSRQGNTYVGGQFYDGRATTLEEQAKGPFLNRSEMQMPDVSSVVARLMESDTYVSSIQSIYGRSVLDSDENTFNAMADAIATFERSAEVSTFDAKFDKVAQGLAQFTPQEQLGRELFERAQCSSCHTTRTARVLFSNYGYENIGVPSNSMLQNFHAQGNSFIDRGLFNTVNDVRQEGRFKVPSLRNVSVSAPYMHNGVFKNLKTVVHFYNTRDVEGAINPETNQNWSTSEVRRNRVGGRRIGNLRLSSSEEDALVAFLRTLTDARYEHLQ